MLMKILVNTISAKDFLLKKLFNIITLIDLFIGFLVSDKKVNPNTPFYENIDALTTKVECIQLMNMLWNYFVIF